MGPLSLIKFKLALPFLYDSLEGNKQYNEISIKGEKVRQSSPSQSLESDGKDEAEQIVVIPHL